MASSSSSSSSTGTAASSALFAPFRSVGQIVDGQQMTVYSLGSETFFTTPVGNAFQVYNADHLSISLVSRPLSHPISHVAVHKDKTFSVAGSSIYAWKKAIPVRRFSWEGGAAVVALESLGDYLLSLHADNTVRVWDAKGACAVESTAADISVDSSKEFLLNTVSLPTDGSIGTVTCMLHPSTYLNKVCIGTSTGSLLIVNIRTGRLVYECKGKGGGLSKHGKKTGLAACEGIPVTCLAQSEVVDVVAAGFEDGRIVVHNLRADESICKFSHSRADQPMAGGAVTAVAFSQDSVPGAPTLLSATSSGALALWNLSSKSLQALVTSAHDGAVSIASWLPHQPCILTASAADNSLTVWQVDKLDGQPRMLRTRSGHQAPPRMIRYYGGASVTSLASGANATACEIASAGSSDRSLRMFHTALAQQSTELSQGSIVSKAREMKVHPNTLRLPPITAMAVSDRRHSQWSDVITAHAGENRAFLWSWDKKKLEPTVLTVPAPPSSSALGAALSSAAAATSSGAGSAGANSSGGSSGGVRKGSETVSAVCISACGNYGFVGTSQGSVFQYNLQSGALRGSYPKEDAETIMMMSSNGTATKGGKRGPLTATSNINADAAPDADDIGKGRKALHKLNVVDSFDTTMLKVMGVLPPALALLEQQRQQQQQQQQQQQGKGGKGAAAATSSSSSSSTSTVAVSAFASAGPKRHALGSAILGLCVDNLNKTLVSCDSNGLVLFWDFASKALLGSLELPGGCGKNCVLHADSGLLAIPCPEDFTVLVVDIATRKVVRRCVGHTNSVTDLCFSPDGRWLVSSSLDRSIRVWDLPTGRCVDWLLFDSAPTSVAFSPTSEYLATTHSDLLGISLWANKAHFGKVLLEGSVAPKRPTKMGLPLNVVETAGGAMSTKAMLEAEDTEEGAASGKGRGKKAAHPHSLYSSSSSSSSSSGPLVLVGQKRKRSEMEDEKEQEGDATADASSSSSSSSNAPKPGCSITLSTVPVSQWQNLSKLDIIAARNKPIEAPKKPASAPFFLPTTSGIKPTFTTSFAAPDAGAASAGEAGAAADKDAAGQSGGSSSQWMDEDDDNDNDNEEAVEEAGGSSKVGRIISSKGFGRVARSRLADLLRSFGSNSGVERSSSIKEEEWKSIFGHLCSLAPGAADLEIRSLCLGSEDDDGIALLQSMLRYFAAALASGVGFDISNAHLQLFLQLYQETIADKEELTAVLAKEVRPAQEKHANGLRSLLDQSLSLVNTLIA